MQRLFVLELAAVVAFSILAAWAVFSVPEPIRAISVEALATGPAQESWSGIFIGDRHVGWSMSKESATESGGRVSENRTSFALGAQGATQQITMASTAVADAAGQLQQFDFLLESVVSLRAHGVVVPGAVQVEVEQGGSIQTLEIPVPQPPVLSLTAGQLVRGRDLKPGDTFETPYFSLVTMSQSTMTMTVEAPELQPNGKIAHWLRMTAAGMTTRRLVDENGDVLREEDTTLGLKQVRMTRAEALAVDEGDPPDLVALTQVPLTGFIDPARPYGPLALRVTGASDQPLPSEGDIQRVSGDVVTLTTPDPSLWPVLAVRGSGDLEATLSLPVANEEIVARANSVVGDAPDRATAARRLNEFVFEYVAKTPTIGIPNGLEVLRSGQGDCNEHTALYVSLARAAGIPSRIAAGLVYNEAMGAAFYYHAWPEVRLGPGESWVAVDPTFGEFPAKATHIKVVTGDLDKQVRILGLLGRLKISVEPSAAPDKAPPR